MNILQRLLRWLGLHKPALPIAAKRWGVASKRDGIVGSRLRNLVDAKWLGRELVLEMGDTESELRSSIKDLTRIELSDLAVARRASEVRTSIESILAPDSRFASLIGSWPGNWSSAQDRFILTRDDLREVAATARSVSDVAQSARKSEVQFGILRDKHSRKQPVLWEEVSEDMGLVLLLKHLESPSSVTSFQHRMQIVDDLLTERETLLTNSRDTLLAGLGALDSAQRGPEAPSIEAEVARLKQLIPQVCGAHIEAYGQRAIASATTHLGRLEPPSDRSLRAGMMALFKRQPQGPILIWARLHYSRQRSARSGAS